MFCLAAVARIPIELYLMRSVLCWAGYSRQRKTDVVYSAAARNPTAFARDTLLKHLDVVDITKELFDPAVPFPGLGSPNPLRDPGVTPFVQDGRFSLQASPESYDIITGDPPPLKVAGTVNLYTQQF